MTIKNLTIRRFTAEEAGGSSPGSAPELPTPGMAPEPPTPETPEPEVLEQETPNAEVPEAPKAEDLGFPENTPVADMTDPQKAAYWRNVAKNRQTDQRELQRQLDTLKRQLERVNMNDFERANAEREDELREETRSATVAEFSSTLVGKEFRLQAAQLNIAQSRVDALLGKLKTEEFFDANTRDADPELVRRYLQDVVLVDIKRDPNLGAQGAPGQTGSVSYYMEQLAKETAAPAK